MQALQLTRPGQFVSVSLPEPDLRNYDAPRLKVKLRNALICGSDVPKFVGSQEWWSYPLPPGMPIHECLGQVVESSHPLFRAGDWVVAMPDGDQGLSEIFIADPARAVSVDAELARSEACAIVQPLATVLHGIDCLGNVAGQSCIVAGLGPIGQLFVFMLAQSGASSIVGVDPNPWKCDFARSLGATTTFPMPVHDLVIAQRDNDGVLEPSDIGLEVVGHQTRTINELMELVRHKGCILAFGVPDERIYPFAYELFFRKNLHIVASVTPVWAEYMPAALEILRQKRAILERFVTHTVDLSSLEKGYSMYGSSHIDVLKVMIDASAWW